MKKLLLILLLTTSAFAEDEEKFGAMASFNFKISKAVHDLRADLEAFDGTGDTPTEAQMAKIHKDEKALDKAVKDFEQANH